MARIITPLCFRLPQTPHHVDRSTTTQRSARVLGFDTCRPRRARRRLAPLPLPPAFSERWQSPSDPETARRISPQTDPIATSPYERSFLLNPSPSNDLSKQYAEARCCPRVIPLRRYLCRGHQDLPQSTIHRLDVDLPLNAQWPPSALGPSRLWSSAYDHMLAYG
jgi:hypothetical protein